MKQLFCLIVCLSAIGCRNADKARNLDIADGTITNSDIISQIDFVYLHDSDRFLMGRACAIKSFGGNWYVLDNEQRNALMVFGETGEPKAIYDREGRGSGEYAYIAGFDIDPGTGEVYILCGPPKIIILDKDLNFKRDITLDKFYDRMVCCDGGFMLFSGQDCTVDYLPEKGGPAEQIFSAPADHYYIDNRNPVFIRDNESLFFQTQSDDALYRIVGRKFIRVAEYDYLNRMESQHKHAREKVIGEDALKYSRPQVLCVLQRGDNLSFIYRQLIYRLNMERDGNCLNLDMNLFGLDSSLIKIGRKLVGWTYSYNYNPARFNESGIYDGITVNHIPWDDRSREGGNPVLIIYTLKPEFTE